MKEFVMGPNILFFDIDGTILTEDGTRMIPDSTRKAITQAKRNGHLTFINTGRVYLNVEPMIRDLGFDGYVCGCGTDIYYQEKELFHKTLSKELCCETVKWLRASHVSALFEASDLNAVDISLESNPMLEDLVAYFSESGRKMIGVEDEEFHFDKFTAWYPLHRDMKPLQDFLEQSFDCIDRGTVGTYGMWEVVPKGYSKATGMQYLLDYFQIPHQNSYAFGDSTNDLPMLEYAAHSVAMGDSAAVVRNAVEYVTKSIHEDGLAWAMRHYHLIMEI